MAAIAKNAHIKPSRSGVRSRARAPHASSSPWVSRKTGRLKLPRRRTSNDNHMAETARIALVTSATAGSALDLQAARGARLGSYSPRATPAKQVGRQALQDKVDVISPSRRSELPQHPLGVAASRAPGAHKLAREQPRPRRPGCRTPRSKLDTYRDTLERTFRPLHSRSGVPAHESKRYGRIGYLNGLDSPAMGLGPLLIGYRRRR